MNHYRHHTGLLAQTARSLVSTRVHSAASITRTSAFHTSLPRQSRSSQKNHYESLGLTKDATKKEIKAQFYKLSKMHHPDKNASEESRKAFLSINEAYSVLGNERQRRDYDLTLLDKSGSLYSNSSSQRSAPTRGTLRRTPFRHSAQSAAAAAAAARTHAAFRPQYGYRQSVSHFDSKSHQEMHYEQELRQEERRQARMRATAEFKEQQAFDESDTWASKFLRASLVLVMVMLSTSLMKAFADEDNDDEEHDYHPRNQRIQWPINADDNEGNSSQSEGSIHPALQSRHST